MSAVPTPWDAPAVPPSERVRMAWQDRPRTDYLFGFWSALGWTVLTFGIYGYYVFYQLVRRSRDHNRRRLELLESAYLVAWDRAGAQGKQEELRPAFERVAAELEVLRRMTTDFRDPAIWLVLDIVARGIVWYVALVLLDQDLVRHEWHERNAAAGLAHLYTALGTPVPGPTAPTKTQHNYVGRVVATVVSLGFYSFWWTYDVMVEGNRNFTDDWAWEDALARAVQAGLTG